jgi:parvulin-like peptidyl-prolyl isomerase
MSLRTNSKTRFITNKVRFSQVMIDTVNFRGVKATVRNTNFRFLTIAVLAFVILALTGCPSGTTGNGNTISKNIDPNETAATVNGKAITMEQVERAVKQQAQGQESKLSQLELAQARLQVLESLIQQEVMFQKAEKEATVPSDDEVTAEYNKRRTASGLSVEQFEAKMKELGENEASARDAIKKGLAIQKLIDKITGKIEPPKDEEINNFYNGNKAAFVKKRGVKLAAIVIDPAKTGEGDTTVDEQSAVIKGNEIINQLKQGADFATVAREKSEDQSKFQGGDLGYISEEEMKQSFPPQIIGALMSPQTQIGQLLPTPMQGKFYIFKLQERADKDENLTLESPGIREKVTNSLVDARKQLLSQSYAAIAMNEAKIENFLAQKVVSNPNELSGARPAGMDTPAANTNTNANTNANTMNANANVKAVNANTNTKPAAKTNANTNAR